MELDLVEIEPERFRGQLGECCPGALAHVCASGLNERCPVGPQSGACLGGELRAGEDGRSHTPADEKAVFIAHRGGFKRTV